MFSLTEIDFSDILYRDCCLSAGSFFDINQTFLWTTHLVFCFVFLSLYVHFSLTSCARNVLLNILSFLS